MESITPSDSAAGSDVLAAGAAGAGAGAGLAGGAAFGVALGVGGDFLTTAALVGAPGGVLAGGLVSSGTFPVYPGPGNGE